MVEFANVQWADFAPAGQNPNDLDLGAFHHNKIYVLIAERLYSNRDKSIPISQGVLFRFLLEVFEE